MTVNVDRKRKLTRLERSQSAPICKVLTKKGSWRLLVDQQVVQRIFNAFHDNKLIDVCSNKANHQHNLQQIKVHHHFFCLKKFEILRTESGSNAGFYLTHSIKEILVEFGSKLDNYAPT